MRSAGDQTSLRTESFEEEYALELESDLIRASKNAGFDGILTVLNRKGKIEPITIPSWLQPIIRRDHDFKNTGKPRFESSNSLSCGIFKEVKTNKQWLGKSLTSNREQSEALAVKERIASDIYAYFGVKVPKIELSLQKMTNLVEFSGVEGKNSIHTMSELVEDFTTYKEAFGNTFDIANPNLKQDIVLPNGESISERGLGKILAVATLINDIDVIGANGGNIGFQIVSHPTEGKYAQTIKIDPGEAFAINDVSHPRKIRVAFTGTPKETELHFDDLPDGTKKEFLATVHKISETTEATFRGFFTREGAHHFVVHHNLTIDELAKFLMDRKAIMLQVYQEYLDDARTLFQEEQKITDINRDAEERARSNAHQAYQEELYYYIDPFIIYKEDPTKQIPLKIAMDQYLDFERENKAQVILIKGESGAGKSLALRFFEQRLLEKRRRHRTSPMPIHIDLKKFNSRDVKESFQRVLKEKYCGEYDPNKTRLVVLMDGYDEIAGRCESNLYDIQQLGRYSKNLRVIITCRTQYLTTGYQEWFKPAEGQLKELEIQQFNDGQIYEYLKKYSKELEKTGKESYSPVQYQERIEEYPGLKDLIVNPFLLRLVAESLPRLNEYIHRKQAGIKTSNNRRGEEEEKKTAESVVLNRYAIYECIMEHWFAKQKIRLMQRSAIEGFRDFSRKIALILLSKREFEIKIKEDELWEVYFGYSNPDLVRARNGCPLIRQNDYQYSFIHKSLLEYFVANGILDTIVNNNSRLYKTIKLLPDLIIQNPGVMSFLRDAFALNSNLKDICFNWINASNVLNPKAEEAYQNPKTEINASNAITLLNVVNYDFSGLDLSNISIPNANLSYGTFKQTNFTNANLKNVNFASSWLKDANFKGANLNGVNFGEWPYLQFEEPIRCISFSADGKMIAAATGTTTIIFMRDVKTGNIRELKRIQDKSGKTVEYCKLNADGKQAIICSKDNAPCMWDITTGDCLFELQEGSGYEATTFDFSYDGKRVAFSSEDNSIHIWNITTGRLTHEFRGHLDKITNCKFSPDGSQIVSASQDKTLRIWDVVSGLSVQEITKAGPTKTSLNLTGANIEDVAQLSDINLVLLHQRGGCGFSEKEQKRFIENLNDSIGNQKQDFVKLELSHKSLNDEGALGIGKYASWLNLTELNLSQNYIGNKGAAGLGSNLTWLNLKKLFLAFNRIEDEGAKGLAKNSSWNNLEELDLRNNQIGDDGARFLLSNTEWKRLESVHLKDNKLSSVSTVMRSTNEQYCNYIMDLKNNSPSQLAEDGYIENTMRMLNENFIKEIEQYKDERKAEFVSILEKRTKKELNREDLKKEGVIAMPNEKKINPLWMPYVQSLDLTHGGIGSAGIGSIGRSASLFYFPNTKIQHQVVTLKLSENILGDEGCKRLVDNEVWTHLETLDLSKNKIGKLGATVIGNHSRWTRLRYLDLSDNKIDDEGCQEFAKNENWKNLEHLSLSHNNIGDAGIEALSKNATWNRLKVLFLNLNRISDEGGINLAENKAFSNIEQLDLSNNFITAEGAKTIWNSSNRMKLQVVRLANRQLRDMTFFFGRDISCNSILYHGDMMVGTNEIWTQLIKHNNNARTQKENLKAKKPHKNANTSESSGSSELSYAFEEDSKIPSNSDVSFSDTSCTSPKNSFSIKRTALDNAELNYPLQKSNKMQEIQFSVHKNDTSKNFARLTASKYQEEKKDEPDEEKSVSYQSEIRFSQLGNNPEPRNNLREDYDSSLSTSSGRSISLNTRLNISNVVASQL